MKQLHWWIEEGQYEEKKKQGRGGLCDSEDNLKSFIDLVFEDGRNRAGECHRKSCSEAHRAKKLDRVVVGCDFGSTTAKAVCLSPDQELLFSCYALSKGNPIEDAT